MQLRLIHILLILVVAAFVTVAIKNYHQQKLSTTPLPLSRVKYWAYQIQKLDEPGAVEELARSHYDLLVLEPTRTDKDADIASFDTRGMVEKLKNTKAHDGVHRKLVIAYIDIGQAENWRWYWTWSEEWQKEQPRPLDWPDYILTHDPDGWADNYPVAFWDSRWKDIVIYGKNSQSRGPDYNSMLDEVIKDGFDGIYLDWVEAFENEEVVRQAQKRGRGPAEEMITFIREMKTYAKSKNPNFLIVQQNAPSLAQEGRERKLFQVIDAIAQEDIWYDGIADTPWSNPKGHDLPVEEEITQTLLEELLVFQKAKIPIFNVEYALLFADDAYKKSKEKGFIPYVTRKSLEKLTSTPPPTLAQSQILQTFEKRLDGATRVTSCTPPQSCQNPVFSPDSASILYTRFQNGYNIGPSHLVRVDLTSGNEQVIINGVGATNVNVPYGSWTDDQITWASDRGGGADEIYIAKKDGSDIIQITNHKVSQENSLEPVFNPKDPSAIAFEYVPSDTAPHQIAVVESDRQNRVTSLTTGVTFDDRLPSWSQDGTKLLFQRAHKGKDDWEIYVGTIVLKPTPYITNLQNISQSPSYDTDNSWAKNDTYILSSSDFGYIEMPNIFAFPANGGKPIRITYSAYSEDGAPSYAPNGQWIAFESHAGQDENLPSNIWIIQASPLNSENTVTYPMNVTFYGFADNDPPSDTIAYPQSEYPMARHNKASGTGTYDDPLTMASDPSKWPIGTRMYIPYLKKYVIMEDSCASCIADWQKKRQYHIDVWMQSDDGFKDELLQCENHWTRRRIRVEIDPPAGREVSTTPPFNKASGKCL